MKIWLVFDRKHDAGFGHLSRLVALGQELNSIGHSYCFHTVHALENTVKDFIVRNGLDPNCSCYTQPKLVVVDTYNPDIVGQLRLEKTTPIVRIIDEISPVSDAIGIIEASPVPASRVYPQGVEALKFKNAPLLRDEVFLTAQTPPIPEEQRTEWALILGGISDSIYIEILKLISGYSKMFLREVEVVSSSNVVEVYARSVGVTKFKPSLSISDLSRKYRNVISGAGVTAWELSFLQVPGFVLGVASNQMFQVEYLGSNRIRSGMNLDTANFTEQFHNFVKSKDFDASLVPSGGGRADVVTFLGQLELLDPVNPKAFRS
jgi:spore coat polysaccharide biosynthesis predicted glycosyltransferase SpsG